MGCAKDIVENAGAPRFWFSDFPLGHSAGKPFDSESQSQTVAGALGVLGSATAANTTAQSSQIWSDDESWKKDFMDVSALSQDQIEKLKKAHENTRAMKDKAVQS